MKLHSLTMAALIALGIAAGGVALAAPEEAGLRPETQKKITEALRASQFDDAEKQLAEEGNYFLDQTPMPLGRLLPVLDLQSSLADYYAKEAERRYVSDYAAGIQMLGRAKRCSDAAGKLFDSVYQKIQAAHTAGGDEVRLLVEWKRKYDESSARIKLQAIRRQVNLEEAVSGLARLSSVEDNSKGALVLDQAEVTEVRQAIEKKQFVQAQTLIDKLHAEYTGYSVKDDILHLQAELEAAQANFDQAIEVYRRISTLVPEKTYPYREIGNIYYARKEFDKAAAAYLDCIRTSKEPSHSDYYSLALCYYDKAFYALDVNIKEGQKALAAAGKARDKMMAIFEANREQFQTISGNNKTVAYELLSRKELYSKFSSQLTDLEHRYGEELSGQEEQINVDKEELRQELEGKIAKPKPADEAAPNAPGAGDGAQPPAGQDEAKKDEAGAKKPEAKKDDKKSEDDGGW